MTAERVRQGRAFAAPFVQRPVLQVQDEASAIVDDTMVDFEGSSVRWGDLTLQDRKAYLAGGYPY